MLQDPAMSFPLPSLLSTEGNSTAYKTGCTWGRHSITDQDEKTSPLPSDFWGSLSVVRRKIKVAGGVGRIPAPLRKQRCFLILKEKLCIESGRTAQPHFPRSLGQLLSPATAFQLGLSEVEPQPGHVGGAQAEADRYKLHFKY